MEILSSRKMERESSLCTDMEQSPEYIVKLKNQGEE